MFLFIFLLRSVLLCASNSEDVVYGLLLHVSPSISFLISFSRKLTLPEEVIVEVSETVHGLLSGYRFFSILGLLVACFLLPKNLHCSNHRFLDIFRNCDLNFFLQQSKASGIAALRMLVERGR